MVAKKLNMIMKEAEAIGKDTTIETKRGSYVVRSEDAVLRKIRPLFVKHGLVMYPIEMSPNRVGQLTCLTVTYVIVDTEDDDAITVQTYGEGYDPADKGAGKAFTYATKNLLIKLILAVSGEDTDNTSSDKLMQNESETLKKYNDIIARIDNANIPESNKKVLKDKTAKYATDEEMLQNVMKYLDSVNI
jgi:hypothetical protein